MEAVLVADTGHKSNVVSVAFRDCPNMSECFHTHPCKNTYSTHYTFLLTPFCSGSCSAPMSMASMIGCFANFHVRSQNVHMTRLDTVRQSLPSLDTLRARCTYKLRACGKRPLWTLSKLVSTSVDQLPLCSAERQSQKELFCDRVARTRSWHTGCA